MSIKKYKRLFAILALIMIAAMILGSVSSAFVSIP